MPKVRFEADKLGYPSNFTIYDTQDSQRLISAIIKEMQLDKDIYKYKQIYSRISSFKNSLITVKAYANNPDLVEADAMAKRPRMGEIYAEYVDCLLYTSPSPRDQRGSRMPSSA